jgi:sugar lactone lactonase YvrE
MGSILQNAKLSFIKVLSICFLFAAYCNKAQAQNTAPVFAYPSDTITLCAVQYTEVNISSFLGITDPDANQSNTIGPVVNPSFIGSLVTGGGILTTGVNVLPTGWKIFVYSFGIDSMELSVDDHNGGYTTRTFYIRIKQKPTSVRDTFHCLPYTYLGTTFTTPAYVNIDTLIYNAANGCDSLVYVNNFAVNKYWQYKDNDNDGFGSLTDSIYNCNLLPGYVTNFDDCNDMDSSAFTNTYYIDADGDGRGGPNTATACGSQCVAPVGYSLYANDCDDNDPNDNCHITGLQSSTNTICNQLGIQQEEITTCNLTILDKGGYGTFYGPANYLSSNVIHGPIVLKPATAGQYIKLVIDSLNMEYCGMTIWDGSGTTGTVLYSGQAANYTGNWSFGSTANDGSLTIEFTNYFAGANGIIGFNAKVTCEPSICTPAYYYRDNDGDGFGDPNGTVISSCTVPVFYLSGTPINYVNNNADCDDNNSSIKPYVISQYTQACGTSAMVNGIVVTADTTITTNFTSSTGCDSTNVFGVQFFTPATYTLTTADTLCYGSGDIEFVTKNTISADAINLDDSTTSSWNVQSTYSNPTVVTGNNVAGAQLNRLNSPSKMVLDTAGNLYLCDVNNSRIMKYTPGNATGTIIAGTAGSIGTGPNQLFYPAGIAIDKTQQWLYIADGSNRVIKISTSGTNSVTLVDASFGGVSYGQLTNLIDVAVDDSDNIYALDGVNTSKVVKYTPGSTTGVIVAGAGGTGAGANQLNYANAIELDKLGNIYIADELNSRIQMYTPNATTGITIIGNSNGTAGNSATELNYPEDLVFDNEGNLIVADAYNYRTMKYAPGSNVGVPIISGSTSINNTFYQYFITGLAIDKTGNLYTNSRGEHLVAKWEYKEGIEFSPTSPGHYVFNFNSPTSQCDALSDTITVIAPPVINLATNNIYLCKPDSIYLHATTPNGSISWNNGVQDSIGFYLNSEQTFEVTATDAIAGCTNTATVVTDLHTPKEIVIIGGDKICGQSGSVVMEVTGYSDSYQWYKNGVQLSFDTSAAYTANSADSFTVIVSTNTCLDTLSKVLETAPPVVASFNVTPSVCQGASVVITAIVAPECDTTIGDYSTTINSYDGYSYNDGGTYAVTSDTLTIETVTGYTYDGSYYVGYEHDGNSKRFISFDWEYTTTASASSDRFTLDVYGGTTFQPFVFSTTSGNATQTGQVSFELGNNESFEIGCYTDGAGGTGKLKIFNYKVGTCQRPYLIGAYDNIDSTNFINLFDNDLTLDFVPQNIGVDTVYVRVTNTNSGCETDSLIPVSFTVNASPVINDMELVSYKAVLGSPNDICMLDSAVATVSYTNGHYALWQPFATIGDTIAIPSLEDLAVTVVDSISGCFTTDNMDNYYNINYPYSSEYIESPNSVCPGETFQINAYGYNPVTFADGYISGTDTAIYSTTYFTAFSTDPNSGCTAKLLSYTQVNEQIEIDSVVANKTAICDGEEVHIQLYTSNNITSYKEDTITYSKEIPSGTVTYLCKNGVALKPLSSTEFEQGIFDAIPIPFDFRFYTKQYNKAYVCLNGYISFSESEKYYRKSNVAFLPDLGSSPSASIVCGGTGFAADVNNTSVRYFTNGVAPNRKFVIEYDLVLNTNYVTPYKAQVVLHEGSNQISIILDTLNTNPHYYNGAMGIQSEVASKGQCVDNTCANNGMLYSKKAFQLSPIYDSSNVQIGISNMIGISNTPDNQLLYSALPIDSVTMFEFAMKIPNVSCSNQITDTIIIYKNNPVQVVPTASGTSFCNNTSVVLNATGASTYTWSDTSIITNVAFAAVTGSNIYTVTGADALGCTGTSTIEVTVAPGSNNLALALSSNTSSTAGVDSMQQVQPDGTTVNYVDVNCNLIASVNDGMGGNALGSTMATVHVEASTPVYVTQPYVSRWYQITPTNQGAASVTLYFTQNDFDTYNTYAQSNGWPLLPVSGNNADANIANIRITKVDNGALGTGSLSVITPTSTWDSINNYWTLTFNVPSFSGFYVHSVNANNSPLAIDAVLKGSMTTNSNYLQWHLNNATNVQSVQLLHSIDGASYKPVSLLPATQKEFDHSNYSEGKNYYKLLLNKIDGTYTFSNSILLDRVQTNDVVTVYPNPAKENINIALQGLTKNSIVEIRIFDATGKLVLNDSRKVTQTLDVITYPINELAVGLYHLQVRQANGKVHVQKWHKAE